MKLFDSHLRLTCKLSIQLTKPVAHRQKPRLIALIVWAAMALAAVVC